MDATSTTKPFTPVIEKIKHLLALSTSSNPHEAALAASRAQELLMKHNLKMSQIKTDDDPTGNYAQSCVRTGQKRWKRSLLFAIARHNFCTCVYNLTQRNMMLIGEPHNFEVVEYLYTFLVGQLHEMAENTYMTYLKRGASVNKKTWIEGFYNGAIARIDVRLEEQQRQMAADSNDCKALIVTKEAELKAAMDKFYPDRRPGRRQKSKVDLTGFYDGVEAGDKVALNKAIEA